MVGDCVELGEEVLDEVGEEDGEALCDEDCEGDDDMLGV